MENDLVQVVIRTGQPGYAPEDQVISMYKINSYFSKTEVTSRKLVSLVTASLRTYELARALHQELTLRKKAEQDLRRLNRDLEKKIEARTRELFRANQMKSQFLSMFRIRTDEKGVSLDAHVDEALPHVMAGDEVRIKQIMVNLVGNAVKFTDSGRITVRASLEEATGSRVRMGLEVSDTGPGLDDAFKEKLFEKFSQQDASTTRKYGGTGLGLAITKQLALLMGGSIDAWNRPEGGAVFKVVLALETSEDNDKKKFDSALKDKEIAVLKKKILDVGPKVLVAEDNIINQKVIRLLLEKMGLVPDLVEDGGQVLEKLACSRYDVLIMDVQMPVLDGLATARRIRDPEAGLPARHIPIIALTAMAMAEDARACIEAGMDHVLTKPVYPRKLVQALARVLDI